jgi:hypothetical protein
MEIPSELDIKTCEGLTRLFRYAIERRNKDEDRASLRRLEVRFGLPPYEPEFSGTMQDFARHLDSLDRKQRFTAVCGLISDAIGGDGRLDVELGDTLLEISSEQRIVRFSFLPCLLPCLRHAQDNLPTGSRRSSGNEVRYSGIGLDRELMAFASLFLNLPIYTETNPPWDPDTLLDGDEPNVELPELEISSPPADSRLADAPQIEASVRASRLPRAVSHGKFDLESVMLNYLCDAEGAAFAFTSRNFLSSPVQSRQLTRQRLLDSLRVCQVSELTLKEPHLFAIELDTIRHPNETVRMLATTALAPRPETAHSRTTFSRNNVLVPVDAIRSAGFTLEPARYLGPSAAGGASMAEKMSNVFRPPRYALADFFEVKRPKTTKADPVGTLGIQEVRAGNITANGEISGALRKISIRSTLEIGLEEQVIKPGDILFAHRGPIGHVAYVTEADIRESKIWAGQTVLIFRARKKSSGDRDMQYCDPRVLFMYLLTPEVRRKWRSIAIGDRSPAIPIGEVESFKLPDNLLLAKKPKRAGLSVGAGNPCSPTELILAEYQDRQNNLLKLQKIQASMKDGLRRVSETAWVKRDSSNDS